METIPGNETPLNILVVEDNPGDVYIIKELLKSKGTKFALDHSSRLGDAIKMAGKKEFDVILLDLGLPDSVGLETLKKFKASQVKVPVVVMTGLDDEDVALTSVKVGAQDYLVKNNLTPENILRAIRYGIERKKNEEALQKLNEELESKIQIRTKELAETNHLLKLELDERKRAEEKLAESEEKYRLLFTEMIDGFALHEIITDNNGDPSDYRFVSINPAFEKMMGLKARDIIGKTVFDMMPVSGEKWIKIYSKVTLTGKSADFESYYSELDKYFKVSAFCPKTGLIAVIFEDITARTLIEKEKRIAEKKLKKYASDLKDLNATKDKFFGIIAHDLKNPFSSLLGASELLINYIDEFDTKNVKNISKVLHDSAKRGYSLLENLLEWSRSQTGNIKFNPQKLNLGELIAENLSGMKVYVIHKKIKLLSKVDGDIATVVDKNMFNTVLRNLLNNAVKFTHKGGQVTVIAERCDNNIIITVKDTGIGIDPKDIDKLFRLDVQYTKLGTDHEKGTGLGLLLCKEFVEKHGGRIWVESNLKKGSEFKFSIPYVPSHQKSRAHSIPSI